METPPQPPLKPWPKIVQSLVQSLCMGAFILFAFYIFFNARSRLAVASLGASSFIAFYFPNANASRPRFLLGGYACGILCGGLCNYLLFSALPLEQSQNPITSILLCALSVFLTGFCMAQFNFQHPPAAAMAIAMVTTSYPLETGLMVYMLIVLLVVTRWLVNQTFGKYLTPPPAGPKTSLCPPGQQEAAKENPDAPAEPPTAEPDTPAENEKPKPS